ncbi:MAG: hypothetical protein IPN33_05630 [Saprospiraceae bacterium]|nr:hypothetical protein [Saprospiraceae bacterium]
MAADGGYDNTVSVTLPYWLPEGIYYLCLYTDAANGIFENDDENDNTACELIIINAVPDVDLAVTQAGVTGNATPGGVLTLQWRVENVGSTPTTNGVWRDAVYLSQDMLFTPSSDILVHQWQHDGSLQDGESYTRVENFTLPQGLAATPWFLFVVTDHDTATIDNDFSNNYLKVSQVGTGSTVIITFPPQPDLQVTNFAATPQGIAGQPINLSFTVKNEGPGAAPGVWSDVAILSTDLVAGNAGDIVVGQWQRTGPLPATGADNYTVHSQVVLPANASGNYILLLQTDYTATVGETNENNNVRDVSLFVTQALPADLIPYNVGAQAVDTIATDMTVTWKLQNAGINTISGYMQEGIYLSADTIWATRDVLFATRNSFISLTPGSNASHQVTSRLEGLSRRDYFIFIKIDQLNNLPETDEDNNCAIGLAPVFVEVPELPYDSPTPAVMLLEKPIYYRLEVPALFSGETMRLTLSGDHEGAFNELYLRYGESPTRTTHDYFFNTPFDEDQEILVPALTSGRYYAMAYAVDGTTSQDVELHWKIIPFQLTSIVADNGGNTGNVTVQIEGAKFEPGMMVWLSDPALGDIMASNVSIVNSVKAFVTFPLNGVDIGVYDVKAKNNAGTEVALIDGFEVIAGTIGGNPLLTTCSIDNGQGVVILNALDPVTYELQHPPFARPNQVVTITLRFENTGTVDVPAPQRIFAGLNGFPLAPAPDNFDDNMAEIPLIFIEQEGPPDILRPGGVAVQTVYTKATQPQGSMLFKLF